MVAHRPARVPHDVVRWRNDVLVTVGRVHPPPNVVPRGEWQERKTTIPSTRAEAPRHAQQRHAGAGAPHRAKEEREAESGPGLHEAWVYPGRTTVSRSTGAR